MKAVWIDIAEKLAIESRERLLALEARVEDAHETLLHLHEKRCALLRKIDSVRAELMHFETGGGRVSAFLDGHRMLDSFGQDLKHIDEDIAHADKKLRALEDELCEQAKQLGVDIQTTRAYSGRLVEQSRQSVRTREAAHEQEAYESLPPGRYR